MCKQLYNSVELKIKIIAYRRTAGKRSMVATAWAEPILTRVQQMDRMLERFHNSPTRFVNGFKTRADKTVKGSEKYYSRIKESIYLQLDTVQ